VRLAAEGRNEDALRVLTALLRTEPGLFDAQVERARVLGRLGRLDESAAAYRSAMALSPALAPNVALALAEVCLDKGDLAGAEAAARMALAQEGASAQLTLARVALARGDLDRAAQAAALVKGDAVAEARARRGPGRGGRAPGPLRVGASPRGRPRRLGCARPASRRWRACRSSAAMRSPGSPGTRRPKPRCARRSSAIRRTRARTRAWPWSSPSRARASETPAILAAMQRARPGPETRRLADRTREFMRGGAGSEAGS
jgi:hypothetical protein